MSDVQLGDPVIDLANGRALIVLGKAAERADEWSDRNDFDLLSNYGNERLGAEASDTVWTCAYVASLQSEPSKVYDFPESRLGRPAYERAGDADVAGEGRVYDRVARDVLERLFVAADDSRLVETIAHVAGNADLPEDVIGEARELADVKRTIGGGDDE